MSSGSSVMADFGVAALESVSLACRNPYRPDRSMTNQAVVRNLVIAAAFAVVVSACGAASTAEDASASSSSALPVAPSSAGEGVCRDYVMVWGSAVRGDISVDEFLGEVESIANRDDVSSVPGLAEALQIELETQWVPGEYHPLPAPDLEPADICRAQGYLGEAQRSEAPAVREAPDEKEALATARDIDPHLVDVPDALLLNLVENTALIMGRAADDGIALDTAVAQMIDQYVDEIGVEPEQAAMLSIALVAASTRILREDDPGYRYAFDLLDWATITPSDG